MSQTERGKELYSQNEGSQELLLIITVTLLLSVPTRALTRNWNKIPQSVYTIILGIVMGLIFAAVTEGELKNSTLWFPGSSLYVSQFYIPIFMISTMYRTDYANFLKYLPQVILISFYGGIVTPLIVGLILTHQSDDSSSYICGVLRGLSVIPIEPLYVVQILRRLARFKHLETLLETESVVLLIPLFFMHNIFIGLQLMIITEWYHIVTILLRKIILGFLIGLVAGRLQVVLLVYCDNEGYYTGGISVFMTLMVYFTAEFLAFSSGQLALLCNICVLLNKKHKLSPQTDANIMTLWVLIHYISETVCLTFIVMQMTNYIIYHFHIDHAYNAFSVYALALFLRLVGLIMLTPFFYKMTKQINLKGVLVLSCSGIKGAIGVNLSIMLYGCNVLSAGDPYIFQIFTQSVLSYLINATCMKKLLKLVGYAEISEEQRKNVNTYVEMLNRKADYLIYHKKYDRYYAGAYWKLVRSYVKIKYLSDYEENEDENYKTHIYYGKLCDDCEIDVPYNITEREFGVILEETETKIIKLKKIFLIGQYLRGSIDKRCLELINKRLEQKLEFAKYRQTSIDLKTYFITGNFILYIQSVLRRLCKKPKIIPPPKKKPIRQLAFYTIMHFLYDYLIYAGIVVHSVFVIWNNKQCCPWMFKYHVLIWIFDVMELSLKITGFSHNMMIISAIKPYFARKVNFIHFFCVVMTFFNICAVKETDCYRWTIFYFIPSFRFLAVLKLFTLLNFLPMLCPILLKFIENKINARYCLGYELGAASIQCDRDIIVVLHEIIKLKTIRDVFRKELIVNISSFEAQLNQVKEEKPHIALTVKTKQVIQIILNTLEAKVDFLIRFRMYEQQDCNFIQDQLRRLDNSIKKIEMVKACHTQELLQSIPWIMNTKTYNFVENSKTVAWNTGDLVQSKGKASEGVYVVTTGIFHLYIMDNDLSQPANGALPIIDKLLCVDRENAQIVEESLLAGDILGELSYLTGRAYDSNIVAESFCQAYWLTTEDLNQACEANNNPVNGLECQMWKNCCLDLAINILMKVPVYKTRTQADIRNKLESSFMPDLRSYKIFIITEKIQEILLMEGVVESALTGETFVAPMLIPKAVQKIFLSITNEILFCEKNNVKLVIPKLLIVPIDGVTDVEIMKEEGELAESENMICNVNNIKTDTSQCYVRSTLHLVESSPNSIDWDSPDKEIIRLHSYPDLSNIRMTIYDANREKSLMERNRKTNINSGETTRLDNILKQLKKRNAEEVEEEEIEEDDTNLYNL